MSFMTRRQAYSLWLVLLFVLSFAIGRSCQGPRRDERPSRRVPQSRPVRHSGNGALRQL